MITGFIGAVIGAVITSSALTSCYQRASASPLPSSTASVSSLSGQLSRQAITSGQASLAAQAPALTHRLSRHSRLNRAWRSPLTRGALILGLGVAGWRIWQRSSHFNYPETGDRRSQKYLTAITLNHDPRRISKRSNHLSRPRLSQAGESVDDEHNWLDYPLVNAPPASSSVISSPYPDPYPDPQSLSPLFTNGAPQAQEATGNISFLSNNTALGPLSRDSRAKFRALLKKLHLKISSEPFEITSKRITKALQRAGWKGAESSISRDLLASWLYTLLNHDSGLRYHVVVTRILGIIMTTRSDIAGLWKIPRNKVRHLEEQLRIQLLELERTGQLNTPRQLTQDPVTPQGTIYSQTSSPETLSAATKAVSTSLPQLDQQKLPFESPGPTSQLSTETTSQTSESKLTHLLTSENIAPQAYQKAKQVISELMNTQGLSDLDHHILISLTTHQPLSPRQLSSQYNQTTPQQIRRQISHWRDALAISLSATQKYFSSLDEMIVYQNRIFTIISRYSGPQRIIPDKIQPLYHNFNSVNDFLSNSSLPPSLRALFLSQVWHLPAVSISDAARLWARGPSRLQGLVSRIQSQYLDTQNANIRSLRSSLTRGFSKMRSSFSDTAATSRRRKHAKSESAAHYSSTLLTYDQHLGLFHSWSYFKLLHIADAFSVSPPGSPRFYALARQYHQRLANTFERHVFLALVLRQSFTQTEDSSHDITINPQITYLTNHYQRPPGEVFKTQEEISTDFAQHLQKFRVLQHQHSVTNIDLAAQARKSLASLTRDDINFLIHQLGLPEEVTAQIRHDDFQANVLRFFDQTHFLPGERNLFITTTLLLVPPSSKLSHFLPNRQFYLISELESFLISKRYTTRRARNNSSSAKNYPEDHITQPAVLVTYSSSDPEVM